MGTHIEHEDHSWEISIPDHPARTESPGFRRSKAVAHKIADGFVGLLAVLAGAAR